MKALAALMVAAAIVAPGVAHAQTNAPDASPRVRYTLDAGWRFTLDAPSFAESPKAGDATWERVSVPHTWNALDPFDDVEGYRRGVGWYRRPLALDPALKGRRIYLYFEGANQTANVYVNGAYAGGHRGGYTAFAVDVTRYVKWDAPNLLAVQVDNAHDPHVPPLSVGYALYGGIYRDVWLVATDPVHLAVTERASDGVRVTTPRVSEASAEVRAVARVCNDGAQAATVRVRRRVLDRDRRPVADWTSRVELPAAAAAASTSGRTGAACASTDGGPGPAVARPHLWSPDDPYLYTLETTVADDRTGAVLDRVTTSLGMRWMSWSADSGFALNGKKLVLRGTNRHQDLQGLGSALSDDQHVRDMEWVKLMGANFVRLAHYPQDPAVLDAADRLGLLVWEEVPVVDNVTADSAFAGAAREMLREMIAQHANHPSVATWGIMNEVFLWSPEGARIGRQTDTTYMRWVRDFARGMDSVARAMDPTRITTMAIHGSQDYDASGVADVTGMLGLNLYNGWYGGTFDELGGVLDRRHARMPARPIFMSEYGAEDDERVNSTEPARFDFSDTWMLRYHESYLRQIAARPWLAGTAVWNQFDFSQPETGGSIPYRNQKGMLTWDRRPKDVFYLYKSNWNPEPMAYIASRQWTRRAGVDTGGAGTVTQIVDVFANVDSVELLLGGRSLGTKAPNDVKRATWDVPFAAGDNVLVARGRDVEDRLTIHMDAVPARLASAPFTELAVNVGGRAQYAPRSGPVWLGDQPYRAGGFGYLGAASKNEMFDKDLAIRRSADTPLYFDYRSGLEGYRFDVPDGEYEVELLFAEPNAKPGARVFDVGVNGRAAVKGLDLAAQYGVAEAVPLRVATSAAGGRGVTVTFAASAGQPILNAIRVRKRA